MDPKEDKKSVSFSLSFFFFWGGEGGGGGGILRYKAEMSKKNMIWEFPCLLYPSSYKKDIFFGGGWEDSTAKDE